MDKNLFRFIVRHSLRQQVVLLLVTLSSFPFLYYSLELPKIIINKAIGGQDFPKPIFGVELEQIPYLFALSGVFLAFILINGLFKYYINTMKGRLGERMLRRLRYALFKQVLRFPPSRFRRVSAGEIIPMITAEVEPLGGFIGDALVLPLFQGGTLLVYIGFIFAQDPVLGAASILLYPFQGWLIPRLQRRVNTLGKQRVRTMRQIADKIGETIGGISEVHGNHTTHLHLADIANRLGDVYLIRLEIYQRKFMIKFINNFLNQLTPFFFYAIGGYLVIVGQISFGALVAVLAAYKDLAGPWKELLDYYQQKEDIRIKYEQVVEQFDGPDLLPEPSAEAAAAPSLTGPLCFVNVSLTEEGRGTVLENLSCVIPLDRHTAVIGGAETEPFALLAARLLRPTGGRILAGGQDLAVLPESVTGRRLAYVGPTSYLFNGTVRDNLLYGLRHQPERVTAPDAERVTDLDGPAAIRRQRRLAEARASGNLDFDVDADWIDYRSIDCAGPEELSRRLHTVLRQVDLSEEVYGLGLGGTIDPDHRVEVARAILAARDALRSQLDSPGARNLVEPFAAERFNTNATVAENLLFGTPVGPTFAPNRLATVPYVRHILDKVGLTRDLETMGVEVAGTMTELFAGLPPDHEFFDRFSFIAADELPHYAPLVERARAGGLDTLSPGERQRLMALPFKMIPARHRLGLFDAAMQARILEARRAFARDLPVAMRGAVEFFDIGRCNRALTIQENILFGKIVYETMQASDKVARLIGCIVDRQNLRDTIVDIGLDVPVGIGGSRLSAAARQKVALARALLKNPDLLVINQATAGLDGPTQARVHAGLREASRNRGLLWVVHRLGMARDAEQVLVFDGGRIAWHGTYKELLEEESRLHAMLAAE